MSFLSHFSPLRRSILAFGISAPRLGLRAVPHSSTAASTTTRRLHMWSTRSPPPLTMAAPKAPHSSATNILRRRGNASLTSKPNPSASASDAPLTGMARLRRLFKEYGRPALVVYMSISTVDLGLSFLVVKSGVDVEALVDTVKTTLTRWGVWTFAVDGDDEKELHDSIAAAEDEGGELGGRGKPGHASLWTTFLIAYAFHKLLLPIRVPITAAITPGFVRVMRQWGWMKDASAVAKVTAKSAAAAAADTARKSAGLAVVAVGAASAAAAGTSVPPPTPVSRLE
ncbi:hypothetical protein BC828DRAFT_379310 [Blastocladiella britannica]|nr:hypothetical protein BC828DRAFT_379310 [Blastocladiella britannica]